MEENRYFKFHYTLILRNSIKSLYKRNCMASGKFLILLDTLEDSKTITYECQDLRDIDFDSYCTELSYPTSYNSLILKKLRSIDSMLSNLFDDQRCLNKSVNSIKKEIKNCLNAKNGP